MPNPATDPTAYCQQAALNPSGASIEASPAGVKAIDNEIDRLKSRIELLTEAKQNIQRRMRGR